MSEEKLYAVKNDEGQYWDFDTSGFCVPHISGCLTTHSKKQAEIVADEQGGHIVMFVEEPKKVVLTKEQAKIVEKAHTEESAIAFIFFNGESDDDELLMNAYVNGYTVAKEKRYLVELDGLVTTDNAQQYLTKKNGKWFACRRMPGMHQDFTDEELNAAPEWAQQLNREEVTDDGE